MHLLRSTVVLRASSTREFHPDAQAQPPSRESGKIQSTVAAKRWAVVDADNFWLSGIGPCGPPNPDYDATCPDVIALDASKASIPLIAGDNVFAAELHQA